MLPINVKKPLGSQSRMQHVTDFICDIVLSMIVFGPMAYVIGWFIYYLIH